MKTRYIVCLGTSPDDILNGADVDDADFPEDTLERVAAFASEKKARKEFNRRVNGGTNMKVHLLEVKMISSDHGKL